MNLARNFNESLEDFHNIEGEATSGISKGLNAIKCASWDGRRQVARYWYPYLGLYCPDALMIGKTVKGISTRLR